MSTQYPIPRQTRQAILTALAAQTVFGPFDFILFDGADVVVQISTNSGATWSTVDPTAYTVAPASPYPAYPAPFTITFHSGLAVNTKVWVRGERLPSRLTNVTQGGGIRSILLEAELDSQAAAIQEVRRDNDAVQAALAGGGTVPLLASGVGNDSATPGGTVAEALTNLNTRVAAQFDSKAALAAATIDPSVTIARVTGYAAAGDGGGALYKRVNAQPTHGGKVQTANGLWFEIAEPVLDTRMFGAFGVTDDSAALQLWVDCPVSKLKRVGPVVRIDTASLSITSPCTIFGAGPDRTFVSNAGSIIATGSDTLDLILIRSDNVTIRDLYMPGLGTRFAPNKGRAIVIGPDFTLLTDATVTGSALSSATMTATAADLGKLISINGAGAGGTRFTAQIASLGVDAQHINLTSPVVTNVTGATVRYGFARTGTTLENVTIASHSKAVHAVNAANYEFLNCSFQGYDAVESDCVVASDAGDNNQSDCRYACDATAGTCIKNKSGGDLRLINPKCLVANDHIVMDWSDGISGGIFLVGGSLENGGRSNFRVTGDGTAKIEGIQIEGTWMNGSAAPIVFDDAAGVGFVDMVKITGVTVTSGDAAVLVSIGRSVSTILIEGGIFNGNSVGGAVAFSVPHSGPTGSIIFPQVLNCPGGGFSNPFSAAIGYYAIEGNLLSIIGLSGGNGIIERTGGGTWIIQTTGSDGNVLFGAGSGLLGSDGSFSYDATNKVLTLSGATITTSHPTLSLAQTWNAGGVTFTGFKLNVTSTASAAASLLADLQLGSVSKWSVDKSGNITAAGSLNKVTITPPATGATLTIADGKTATHNASTTFAGVDGKTLTVNNSLTLAGTDAKSLTLTNGLTVAGNDGTLTFGASTNATFPAGSGTLAYAAGTNTWSGVNTFSNTTDATNSVTGAIVTSGGVGIAKTLIVNGAAGFGGAVPAAGVAAVFRTATGSNIELSNSGSGGQFVNFNDNRSAYGGRVDFDGLGSNFNYQGATKLSVSSSGVTVQAGLVGNSASGGIGYTTGAGGAVTQATSRTTGVTLNTVTGAITLVSAAGSATPATFTVTDSTVAATDVVHICQKSGTDKYEVFVTHVAAGSFDVTFFTTGGTTTEQPVFNFAVIKGAAA